MRTQFKIPGGSAHVLVPDPVEGLELGMLALYSANASHNVFFGDTEADIVALYRLHRALGALLDALQPGLASPLPDSDPSIVDAMKILHLADSEA